jgi:hypothetical protein
MTQPVNTTLQTEIKQLLKNYPMDAVFHSLNNNPLAHINKQVKQRLGKKFSAHPQLVELTHTLSVFNQRFVQMNDGKLHSVNYHFSLAKQPLYFSYQLLYSTDALFEYVYLSLKFNDHNLLYLQLPLNDFIEEDELFINWQILLQQLNITKLSLSLILDFFAEILTPPEYQQHFANDGDTFLAAYTDIVKLAGLSTLEDKYQLTDFIAKDIKAESGRKSSAREREITIANETLACFHKYLQLATLAEQLARQHHGLTNELTFVIKQTIENSLKAKLIDKLEPTKEYKLIAFIKGLSIIKLVVHSTLDDDIAAFKALSKDLVVGETFERKISFTTASGQLFYCEYIYDREEVIECLISVEGANLDLVSPNPVDVKQCLSALRLTAIDTDLLAECLAILFAPVSTYADVEDTLKEQLLNALNCTSQFNENDSESELLTKLANNSIDFADLPSSLRNTQDFVIAAIQCMDKKNYFANPILECANNKMRDSKSVVLASIQAAPYTLKFASQRLRADKQVVMAAVQVQGLALCWASSALRDDDEVVMAATAENGNALTYASERLQANREIGEQAVSNAGEALTYCSKELQDDKALVKVAVANDCKALSYANARLQDDGEIALLAMQQDPIAFAFISERLQSDNRLLNQAGIIVA